ncbi:DUF6248 family natural product biosynthesis protein [Streptomyces sp. NPDC002776]
MGDRHLPPLPFHCIGRNEPRVDKHACRITDHGGFVVAVILYGPGQQPCQWPGPCTHSADDQTEETASAIGPGIPVAAHELCPRVPSAEPEGQAHPFTEGTEGREGGEAP